MENLSKGLSWTTLERFSTQFIQLILGIIIARLVTPEEYGILGILLIFINIAQIFIDSGLGSALIYRNKVDAGGLGTVFIFNILISTLFSLAIYVGAPYLESFFNIPHLANYLKACILIIFANNFIVVPTAILKIQLAFKSLAFANFVSSTVGGIIGVFFAFNGWGVWALVIMTICKSVLASLLLFYQSKWFPSFSFSRHIFHELYSYAIKIFSASLITTFVEQLSSFVIGKFLSPFSLGIFTRSNQFANLPCTSFGQIVTTVLFPSFVNKSKNQDELSKTYHKCLKVIAFISFPMFIWIAMLSKPLILLFLTDKWADCIIILQILCIGRILFLLANVTEQMLIAIGRSDLFFMQQMVKMGFKILFLTIGLFFGVIGVAFAEALYNLIQFFITNHYAKKMMNISNKKQLYFVLPFIISAFISAMPGFIIAEFYDNYVICILFASIIAVVSYYLLTSKLTDINMLLLPYLYKLRIDIISFINKRAKQ